MLSSRSPGSMVVALHGLWLIDSPPMSTSSVQSAPPAPELQARTTSRPETSGPAGAAQVASVAPASGLVARAAQTGGRERDGISDRRHARAAPVRASAAPTVAISISACTTRSSAASKTAGVQPHSPGIRARTFVAYKKMAPTRAPDPRATCSAGDRRVRRRAGPRRVSRTRRSPSIDDAGVDAVWRVPRQAAKRRISARLPDSDTPPKG